MRIRSERSLNPLADGAVLPSLHGLRLAELEQTSGENLHRLRLILVLGLFILTLNDHTGWKVGDTNRRVRRVYVLTTRPTGTEHIDAQVVGVDIHFDFFGNGHDGNGGCGSVYTVALGFSEWHTLHPMHTRFMT